MKRILYKFSIISLTLALALGSCSDELDKLWKNPNKYAPSPDEVVSGLFTHMQKTRFWMKDYGEWYWLNGIAGSFLEISQISMMWPYADTYINRFATYNYGEITEYFDSGNGNAPARFERLYTELTNYGLIRDEVSVLKGAELDDNVIYLQLATVLKDIVALQTVDLFNSIPFFNAFRGTEGIFFPEYDDPAEIYKAVIEEYKTIAAGLPAIYSKMSPAAVNILKTQDIFFKGDVDKWVQYINAQILKSSVRISGVEADFAKPYIADAIKNLPKEDFVFTSPQVNENRIGNSAGGLVQRGFYEKFYTLTIPDVIMTRMNHGDDSYDINMDDPRLPVIAMGFTPDGTTNRVEYFGVSMNWERNRYYRVTLPTGGGRKWNVTPQDSPAYYVLSPDYPVDVLVKSCPWTPYNPVTYILTETPLHIFTMAEVDLLLAEVSLKNFATTGKSTGQHVNDAVKHSTDFWYMINQSPNYAGDFTEVAKAILTPPKPDASIIGNYAGRIQSALDAAAGVEDKLDIIMQQKYIHLNIMDPFELFAELRRTRHPKLEPITCIGTDRNLQNQTMMLERFRLPDSERTSNFEQYSKVSEFDKYDRPIFWVPESKVNEKYFLPEAIKPPISTPAP